MPEIDQRTLSNGDGLTYKVTHDARVSRFAVAPAKTAPSEAKVWWRWVEDWVEEYVRREIDALRDAIGQAVGMKASELRRALGAEIDLLRRQLAQLRAEFDADRGLKALQAEIAEARRNVPKMPAIAADFEAKQVAMRQEIANLKRELEATRNRLTLVHTELGTVRYQFEKKLPKPAVTISLNTPESSFVVRDDDPAASEAWQRFVENVAASNPGATAQIGGRVNGAA